MSANPDRAARVSHEAPPPALPTRTLWVNGDLVHGAGAMLSLHDRGARDGEGIFETLRVEGGSPRAWNRHMERLVLSAAELGFPVPPAPAVLERALEDVLGANNLTDSAVRITVTRGVPGRRPTRAGCWIEAEPLEGRLWRGTRSGEAGAILSRRSFEPGPLGCHKTTSRIAYNLAREEARAAGADEALLVSRAGHVLEGAVSNVFIAIGGRIVTPPLSSGILPGTVRAAVLRSCETLGLGVREAPLPVLLIRAADEVFLTNAIQGVVPVAFLDGRAVPGRALGVRLRDAVWTDRAG